MSSLIFVMKAWQVMVPFHSSAHSTAATHEEPLSGVGAGLQTEPAPDVHHARLATHGAGSCASGSAHPGWQLLPAVGASVAHSVHLPVKMIPALSEPYHVELVLHNLHVSLAHPGVTAASLTAAGYRWLGDLMSGDRCRWSRSTLPGGLALRSLSSGATS